MTEFYILGELMLYFKKRKNGDIKYPYFQWPKS